MRISDWSSDVCSSDLIITAIKNSLGIHRGDDLADLDVIIIRRNRQARYEARLQDHAERPATRFLRLQIGITSGKNLKCRRPRDWIGESRRNARRRAIGWQISCSRVDKIDVARIVRSEEHTSELQSIMRN